MDLVTPDIGLIVWTGISFGLLYLILKKFAWGPILGAVNEREQSIKDALEAADKAKEEMESLKADNEKILKEVMDKIVGQTNYKFSAYSVEETGSKPQMDHKYDQDLNVGGTGRTPTSVFLSGMS